ncbi:MAG TPA: endolytic transglycosylase MltG [Longimicrobiales bacterium]|nr:endolytic transglycosylase MltG [Longimicrobiales bacterium]
MKYFLRHCALLLIALLAACGSGAGTGERLPVQVPPGAGFAQITDTLEQRGIIKYAPLFRAYARLKKADARVRPGTYGLRKGQSWDSILDDFREGRVMTAKVVVPEGFSVDKIAKRIADVSKRDSTKILDLLTSDSVAKRYGVPGPTLEGYLYPATYDFPIGVHPDTVIARMVGVYKRNWTPARQARADSMKLSEREVITLASIVEKEAKRAQEMATISSVYHNRLRIKYPLQADPTVQYALGSHRARLLYRDIEAARNNPYNTYVIRGLPPGPIGSPSARAIDATLYPAQTKYLYFVARPDGSHIFTNSLAEHNRAKAAVRRQRAQQNAAP